MGFTTASYSSSSPASPHKHRGHSWGPTQERYQYERAFDHPGQYIRHWRQGDIAFLKPEDAFSPQDHQALIQPSEGFKFGYLPPKATAHPVIILSSPTEKSTHVLVTPVSAYSSSEGNNFLPPWKQAPHQWKYHRCFRSFHGCERYTDEFPYLYLEDGKSMPKPRASWLYIQSLWAVPLSVIGIFTKTNDLLRVRQDSIKSILDHMRADCKRWKECMAEMEVYERQANGVICRSPPAAITNWRQSSRPISDGEYRNSVSSDSSKETDSSFHGNQGYTITYAGYTPRPKRTSTSWASVARSNNTTSPASGDNNANTNGTVSATCTTTTATRRASANTGRDYNRNYDHSYPNINRQQGQQQPQQPYNGPRPATNNNEQTSPRLTKNFHRFTKSKALLSMDWRRAVNSVPTVPGILI